MALPAPPREISVRTEIFSGWKEIAKYLGRGVRTVQRYEREIGLPIHRVGGKSHGAVITTKGELDGWVNAGQMRTEPKPKVKSWPGSLTNKNGANFLLIDSEIALTFSSIALGTSDETKRNRTILTARTAYDTIERLRKGIDLTKGEREKLDANVDRLKVALQRLGQTF
jgi:hypothetical protein